MGECSSSDGPRSFPARFAVLPKSAKVFAGRDLQFRTTLVGATSPAPLSWSVVGPGTIDADGRYHAPTSASTADVVADAGHGITDASTVATVLAPALDRPRILSTCYQDSTLDVFDAKTHALAGAFSAGTTAAGIVVDPKSQHAYFSAASQLIAVDLQSMRWHASQPVPGARLSEVALVAGGYIAATDNLGLPNTGGLRIFRIRAGGAPVLVSSAPAGDTPEGIAASADGRTVFVTAINSNAVTRFSIDSHGVAHRTGSATTATRPFGVAVDERHALVFVADNDTARLSGSRNNPGVEAFSLPSLRRAGSLVSTGSKSALPLGVAVDPALSRLFVTNEGLADVAVFSIPSMRRIGTLSAQLTPWLPYLDKQRHRLYVPNARADTISVFDTKQLREVAPPLPTCDYPTSVAIADPQGARGDR